MASKTNPASHKKSVYVAGPLFSDAERTFNRRLKSILLKYFDVYLPQEDGKLLVEMIARGVPAQRASREIFDSDVEAILRCDILLVVLDGRSVDEGAAFELGVAYANGKECVALQTDPRRLLPVGNNPMIQEAVSMVFGSAAGRPSM